MCFVCSRIHALLAFSIPPHSIPQFENQSCLLYQTTADAMPCCSFRFYKEKWLPEQFQILNKHFSYHVAFKFEVTFISKN